MLAKLNILFTRLTNHPDIAKLLLRLIVAGLMLFHGVHKLSTGIDSIGQLLVAHHFPYFIAYGVYLGEVIAPLFVLFGSFTRPMAAIMVINMIVAVIMVDMDHFFTLNQAGGWALELEMFFIFGSLAIMLLGSGRFSVMRNQAYR